MTPPPRPPLRLYLFPHAGATSLLYRPWQPLAPHSLHLHGIDAPGRGTRTRETPVTDYHALVKTLAAHLTADLLTTREHSGTLTYATFGHSFGATLSLAVAAAVTQETGQPPARAYLSAALPPRLQPPDNLADLPDEDLLAKTAADGGTPPQVLAHPAMRTLLLRMLRQDHTVRRAFPTEAATLQTTAPLTLIAARDDPYAPPEAMRQWAAHTTGPIRQVTIPGGHFAAIHHPRDTLALIAADTTGHPGDGTRRAETGEPHVP